MAFYHSSIAYILGSCIAALLYSGFAMCAAVLSWKTLALNALTISQFPLTYLES